MRKSQYIKFALVLAVLLVVLILLAVRCGRTAPEQAPVSPIAAGVSYLQSLEQQDPNTVDQLLKEQRLQEIERLREERLEQLESGELSVWSLFEDYVLLGDSRAVGYYYYEFLPESRVFAEGGATILHLQEHIPDIQALNPASIFLCYGLNDVSIGIWSTPEDYIADFADILAELHTALPEAQVYISSILPAQDPAFDTAPVWRDIPQYSAAVAQMCQGLDYCHFVDCDSLAAAYSDLWDVDGIHVQRTFYPHWAAALITEEYTNGLTAAEDLQDAGPDAE